MIRELFWFEDTALAVTALGDTELAMGKVPAHYSGFAFKLF